MARKLGPRGLKVLSVSVDEGDGERPKVVAWNKEMKPGFPVLHDPDGSAAKAFGLTEGIPYNVVVDRSGKVIGTTSDVDELTNLVRGLPRRNKAPLAFASGGPVARSWVPRRVSRKPPGAGAHYQYLTNTRPACGMKVCGLRPPSPTSIGRVSNSSGETAEPTSAVEVVSKGSCPVTSTVCV